MMLRGVTFTIGVALVLTQACWGQEAIDWPTLGLTPLLVTNTFSFPTVITHANDGTQRLFVVEKVGRIWCIQGSNAQVEPFLDLTDRVLSTGFEQGLLGLAFPPGFSTNNHFYVDYTRQTDGAVVISRFQLSNSNPSSGDTNSEQVLLVIPKPYNNHNGGQLAFGPDGYLYIGVGDGGSEGDPLNNGQDTTTLLGKLLRIDVESGVFPYAVPPDNPFVGNTNYAPEIWAFGLRNPWRFCFDRLTGDLYIGDVGQGRFEEIDFQTANSPGGQNYGWRIMEGPTNYIVPTGFTNFSALTLPVAWYDHASLPTDLSAAVIGGYAYRGPSEPRLNGIYLFADYIAGWIWGLQRIGSNWESMVLLKTNFNITSFGEDDQGNIYVDDYGGGHIYQLNDTQQAWKPSFTPTNGTFISNATVTVTCSTPNAVIHYTSNGLDPGESDPTVPSGGTIQITGSWTNKARAFRPDLLPSDVASLILNFVVTNPVFSPAQGLVSNGTPVSISSLTPGASFYYTTNNTTPTTNSLRYSGPIVIYPPIGLRAIGTKPGYSNSAVATTSYSLAHVAPLTFTPPPGPVLAGTSITLSSPTPGAVIYYTLNGGNPTTNSQIYTGPISAPWPQTLTAQATKPGWASAPVQFVYYGLLSPENTVVTTFAGASAAGFTNASGTLARFSAPTGICIDPAGNLFVADSGNNVIREILASGQVITFAGTGSPGAQDAPATNAQFSGPTGVCMDNSGNLYVADSGNCLVRRIDTNSIVSTLTNPPACLLWQIEVDPAGSLYVGSDATVVKITQDGILSTLAGNGVGWYVQVGLGLDAATNIYAATEFRLWKIAPDGSSVLFAGGPSPGYSDGSRLLARFQGPQDAAVDSATNVFVADVASIRKIQPDGWVSTMAGSVGVGYVNGRCSFARFNTPASLTVDAQGSLYVADYGNNCIRKIWLDTFGIGIPDAWQLAHFGYIGIDPNADPDHDGMSNYAEFWAGTDPLDSNSVLAIKASILSNGLVQLGWQSVAGKGYLLSYSTDLVNWTPLQGAVQGDGSFLSIVDPNDPSQISERFYRLSIVDF